MSLCNYRGLWAIYGPYTIFIYLLTYYFRFRSGTRVPVVLPGGYPGNKLPGYGSPTHNADCTSVQ